MIRTKIHGINISAIILSVLLTCVCIKYAQGTVVHSENQPDRNISLPSNPFMLASESALLQDTTVNYLLPIYLLRKHEQDYERPLWIQAYTQYLAKLTSEARCSKEAQHADMFQKTNEVALSYLVQTAKNERVVMLNESHFVGRHRILAEILLDSLYAYGFRYLGMEAVHENDTMLNKRGFAITSTGFYTREPMMANLVRSAIKKGYHVFGYDDRGQDRSRNQALNIQRKIFAEDSLLGKTFIFAGSGHINEENDQMAQHFFKLTGIDPLTIDQVLFVERTDRFLTILDTSTPIRKCDIFIANNICYNLWADQNDYEIYTISIPENIAEQAKDEALMFVISFFIADEYLKDHRATPVYNHLLKAGEQEISVRLPRGNEYSFIIRNRQGVIMLMRNLIL